MESRAGFQAEIQAKISSIEFPPCTERGRALAAARGASVARWGGSPPRRGSPRRRWPSRGPPRPPGSSCCGRCVDFAAQPVVFKGNFRSFN